jgi:hypothetical protein
MIPALLVGSDRSAWHNSMVDHGSDYTAFGNWAALVDGGLAILSHHRRLDFRTDHRWFSRKICYMYHSVAM